MGKSQPKLGSKASPKAKVAAAIGHFFVMQCTWPFQEGIIMDGL